MHILFVVSEIAPFSKTGGLADVAGKLPMELARSGLEVKVVTPFYRSVRDGGFDPDKPDESITIRLGGETIRISILKKTISRGLSVYFIRYDPFYDRNRLYGTPKGDYPDNAERFILLNKAALSLCGRIGFNPDIIHCHDWQTGLIPAALKAPMGDRSPFRGTRSVFTIHNLAYQGSFPPDTMALSGLPQEFYSIQGLEFYGRMNFLKSGIIFADKVTTVSSRYAEEILTPEFGFGMDGVLRSREDGITGIRNGIDYSEWNPKTDPYIASRYDVEDPSGKTDCKKEAAEIFGLPDLRDTPLFGMITRLAVQKGLDLVVEAVDGILAAGISLIVLGQGDERYERRLQDIARKNPGRISVKIAFDPVLSHKIEAGSDFFLMPSRYEPCGLNQMFSLKYGTIPIVRATGGLDDTIQPFDRTTGEGTGFKFAEYSTSTLLKTIAEAVSVYRDKKNWERLVRNAMRADFSWRATAPAYVRLYKDLKSGK